MNNSNNKNAFDISHFKFDKKSVEKMKEHTIKSVQENLEHGGLLCFDFNNKKIVLEEECIGKECGITIPRSKKCKDGNKALGVFHTHQDRKHFMLSYRDITNPIEYSESIGCIGSGKNTKNPVKCYIINDVNKRREDSHILKEKEKTVYKLIEEREDLLHFFENSDETDIDHEDEERYDEIREELADLYKFKKEYVKKNYHIFNIEDLTD